MIKSENLINEKTIAVDGKDVTIALLEWHDEDSATKQLCALDRANQKTFCETENQWFKISVNGYEAIIYREEVRMFIFNDGTRINIIVTNDDVDFGVKIVKG